MLCFPDYKVDLIILQSVSKIWQIRIFQKIEKNFKLSVTLNFPFQFSIAGIAVAMGQAASPKFKEYQQRVVANAQELASQLQDLGYTIGKNFKCYLNRISPQM